MLKAEECPWSKLNWDVVNELRNAYLNKGYRLIDLVEIARQRGCEVSLKTIWAVVKNKRWYDPYYLRSDGGIELVVG